MQTNRDKQIPWASSIGYLAMKAGAKLLSNPEDGVDLHVTFYMPRPKSHLNSAGQRKPSAPALHTKKPDLDKLLRCVCDALTGVCYADDSQIIRCSVHKTYQDQHPENKIGALITVYGC